MKKLVLRGERTLVRSSLMRQALLKSVPRGKRGTLRRAFPTKDLEFYGLRGQGWGVQPDWKAITDT
jgi:hypothetical protein